MGGMGGMGNMGNMGGDINHHDYLYTLNQATRDWNIAKRRRLIQMAQEEAQCTEKLRRLCERTAEAVALLRILSTRDLGRLVATRLSDSAAAVLRQLTLRALVYDKGGEVLANELISALVADAADAAVAILPDVVDGSSPSASSSAAAAATATASPSPSALLTSAAAAADASVSIRMMNLTGQKQRILNNVKLAAVIAVQGSDATSSKAENGIEPAANVAIASTKTLYVKALVRRAQALLDLGLLKPALDDYRLALRMDPNNESLRRGREELEASIDLLDSSLNPSRNLDNPSEDSDLSFASGSGSKERALTSSSLANSTLATVRQIESRDLGILRKRGDARFKSGDAEGALEAFNLAVQGIVRQIRILDREKEELPVNSTVRNSLDSDRKALEWELLAAMSNGGACLLLMERFVSCVTRCSRAIALLLLLVAPPKNLVENTSITISNNLGGISSSLDRKILDAVLKDDGNKFSEEDLQILGGNLKEEGSPLANGDFLAGAAWDTSALARWAEKSGWIPRCETVEISRNSTELREKDSCKINIVPGAGLSTPMAIKTLGSFWRLISRRSSALGHLKLFSKAAADLELGLRSIIMSLRLRCGSCIAEFDSHFGEFLLCERQGNICKPIDLDKVLRCLDKYEAQQIEDIKSDVVAEGKKIRVCVRDIKKLKELQGVDSK
mmetsp:Transcript_6565/g.12813  ORF Transcript_6565/g.12813 Transcript_6565/m.12813 type:complete len:677 (-) Transcript_6565:46-2076(-)